MGDQLSEKDEPSVGKRPADVDEQVEGQRKDEGADYIGRTMRILGLKKRTQSRRFNTTEDEHDGMLYKSMMKSKCTKSLLTRFPGCLAFLFGVLVPCFILMLMAFIFGFFLARLEAPIEVESNDDALASLFLANRTEAAILSLATNISRVCFESYLLETQLDNDSFNGEILDRTRPAEEAIFLSNNSEAINEFSTKKQSFDDIHQYLRDCGELSRSWIRRRFEESLHAHESAGLSFNWIRCYNGAGSLRKAAFGSGITESSGFQPSNQLRFYTDNWLVDYVRLERSYREEYGKDGVLSVAEAFEASDRALEEATGGDKCNLNIPGSAWFWFTIETTVGYGNQAPVSKGGRALVFTCGFFSILAFAALLSTTGRVVAELTDRSLSSLHPAFERFTHPGWGSLFWGVAWGMWMLLMAKVIVMWKENRTNETLGLNDAYWLSYISTTTVGLGDLYLDPEVLVGIDLLYLPLLYLFGFTLLSAFLGKLSTFVTEHLSNGKRSFVDSVLFNIGGDFDSGVVEDEKAPETAPPPADAGEEKEDIIVQI